MDEPDRIVGVEPPDDPLIELFNRADPHCENCGGLGYRMVTEDEPALPGMPPAERVPCPCTSS